MKFLITAHYKESYYALPRDKRAELSAAAMDWADKCMKDGRCQEVYMFGNFEGHISIWEVASADEMARNTMEYPLIDYVRLEATPLIEWSIVSRLRKEAIAAVQKKAPQKEPVASR